MARTAKILTATNLVENMIEAGPDFTEGGYTMVASETAHTGDTYNPGTGAFTAPSAPAPVPATVTMAQARIALSRAGRLSDVQTLITGTGGETQIWWDHSSIVERANPLVASLGAALSPPLSSSDIDALFRVAGMIA